MSDLENKNKDVLSHLIEGGRMLLFPSQMKLLTAWVAKTVMAAEFHESNRVAIPQSDRTYLMEHKKPPELGWNIWIAPYGGPQWAVQMLHYVGHLFSTAPGEPAVRADGPLNTQMTVITLGHLALYVISSSDEGRTFTMSNETMSDFRRIWPLPPRLEVWPQRRWLQKQDLATIVDSFCTSVGSPPLKLWD
ncbi:MAG: hypothetical protein ABSC92_02375 [Rhizomicrobium sp.]|jgi:hypothetical protein